MATSMTETERRLFAACFIEAKLPKDDGFGTMWRERIMLQGRFSDLLSKPSETALRGCACRWRKNPSLAFMIVDDIEDLEEFLRELPIPDQYDEDRKNEMIGAVRELVIAAKATSSARPPTTEVATRQAAVTFPVPNAQSQTIYYINNVHGNINQGSLEGNDENGANKSSDLRDQIQEGFSKMGHQMENFRHDMNHNAGQLLQGVREATAAKAPRPGSEKPSPSSPRDLHNAFSSAQVATPDAPAPTTSSNGATGPDRLFEKSPNTSLVAKTVQHGFGIQGHNRKSFQNEIKRGDFNIPETHNRKFKDLLTIKKNEGITNIFQIIGNVILVNDPVEEANIKAFAWVEDSDGDYYEDSDWLKGLLEEYNGFKVIHHIQVTFQGEPEESINRIVVATASIDDAREFLEDFLSYLSQGAYKKLATCVIESSVHDAHAMVPISTQVLASVLSHLAKPERLTLQYWDVSLDQESVVGCHSGVKFKGCNFQERPIRPGEKPPGFEPSGGTPWIATLFGKVTKGETTPPETVLVRSAAEGRHRFSTIHLLVSKKVKEGAEPFEKGVYKVHVSSVLFRKPFYVQSEE